MGSKPAERAAAIAAGKDRYFNGKPCRSGHVAERYISGQCVECCAARSRRRRDRILKRNAEVLATLSEPRHRLRTVPRLLTTERLRELIDYDPATGLFRWRVRRVGVRFDKSPGRSAENGYTQITVAGETHLAHRLAWLYMTGKWPKEQVDHIDGNRANNAIANLRECSARQNHWNKRTLSNNKSGLKGAWYNKHDKCWQSAIVVDGVWKRIGRFRTAEEAHAAYCKAAAESFGEFARSA
jgi:hypothetical protein